MLKLQVLLAMLLLCAGSGHAKLSNTYLYSIVSCNSSIDPRANYEIFIQEYGQPYKFESGAWWWKVSGIMYGSKITEVFVSTTKNYHYVGVALAAMPDEVAKNIEQSRYFTTRMFKHDKYRWVGQDGRLVALYGNQTVMGCI